MTDFKIQGGLPGTAQGNMISAQPGLKFLLQRSEYRFGNAEIPSFDSGMRRSPDLAINAVKAAGLVGYQVNTKGQSQPPGRHRPV